MFQGFKKFLMRGNVIDLSVAVVMGAAFTAVVSSVTKGVVEPLLAVMGGNSQYGFGIQLISGKPATFVALGPIVSAGIDFVMVAAVLYFVLILPMNSLVKRFGGPAEAAKPTELELLAEIRDLLAAQQNGSATSQAASQMLARHSR
ncbi:large conductance mechanosensitive channel protein MscL [Nocardia stercoris]|uniref:Large-conductance mechanosensitive channel n=2 Tax=Nocardia stercoris TaxID=2483361 RepID=A0A3M2LE28_9NOCA|nr:large conductance mechanosensitive channel protein MscL [Nocardia stercoris]